jgi:hypothetical protein
VFESFSAWPSPLRTQVSEARSFAAAHQAVAVFWLDADPDAERDWLIFLAEPDGKRVLVRRIPVEKDATQAAVEAAAIITRESTEALLAGETIGMEPVPEEPRVEPATTPVTPLSLEPPSAKPAAAHPKPTLRPFALSLGYYGDAYADQVSWQSGIRLGAIYRWHSGLYGGVGFTRYNDVDVSDPGLAFRVSRTPFDAGGGYSYRFRKFAMGIEGRTIVELTSRHGVSATPPLAPSPDLMRAVVLLSPRFRLEYTPTDEVSIFLGFGVDFALNGFSFASRADGRLSTDLDPRRVRPSAELGIAFWP